MPSKKGPAFDMDSAFSGLFSTAPVQSAVTEEKPVVQTETEIPAQVISAPTSMPAAESNPLPVQEVSVMHRKPDDQLTRQYTITLKKGTHENLRDIAWYTRQSVSSILNNLADEYIRQHTFELEECHKINRR